MNKIIPTDDRLFMSLVGPSGSGKSYLILEMFQNNIFQPFFATVIFFYQHYQSSLFRELEKVVVEQHNAKIEFIQGCDFELVQTLDTSNGNCLSIFDDSCEEIFRSKEFQKLATAGRHRRISVLYIKHNLFNKTPLGRDIELQNTHIVLFKSPRDVQQIRVLSRQLGLGKSLETWYNMATEAPFGHLMIDLQPKTEDTLRYSSGLDPTHFFVTNPARFNSTLESSSFIPLDNEQTELCYSKTVDAFVDRFKEKKY